MFQDIHFRRVTMHALAALAALGAALSLPAPTRAVTPPPPIEWTRQFGSLVPGGRSLTESVDADGGVYVAGVLENNAFLPGQLSVGANDAFVRKYDADGVEQWTRQFGTYNNDQAVQTAVDASGLYVGGQACAALPGQVSSGYCDAFVRKYDPDGVELWTRQFGSSMNDLVVSVTVDSSGLYVVGHTYGTLLGQSTSGGWDAFVRKYDHDGAALWTRQYGSAGDDAAYGVAVYDGGLYVAGATYGVLPGQTSAGAADLYVRKYDTAGTLLWSHQDGTAADEWGEAIAAGATGIYLLGETVGSLPGYTNLGAADGFLRKYTPDGSIVWTRQFGTSGADGAYTVVLDASAVYISGETYGTLPGQTSVGYWDAYIAKYDLNGDVIWLCQYGSTNNDGAYGLAIDGSSLYSAGYTWGALPGQTSSGGRDIHLRKYDLDGGAVWTRQFASYFSGYDLAQAVAEDGSVYVVGQAQALPGQSPMGGTDAYVRKYSPAGTEAWTRQFGTTSSEYAWSVAADATGVYVTGYTAGTLPGQTSAGGSDAFLRKYDADGAELWTRQFGSSSYDYALSVAVGASGVYVAGYTGGVLPGQASQGSVDTFVRKYDSNGADLWTRQFGSSSSDYGYSVAVHGSDVYVSGHTGGILPGQSSAGSSDVFVRKYDAGGAEAWTRQFGSSSYEYNYAVAADAAGVYVAGNTGGTLPGQTSSGSTDAFVRRYDAGGGIGWTRQFGTATSDTAYSVSVDITGVYVAGSTLGTLPGQTTAGLEDAYVRCYDGAGLEQWSRQFGSASGDAALGVSAGSTGVYIVGRTNGRLPGQTSSGSGDGFVVKFNRAPAIAVDQASVSVVEGQIATNAGPVGDPDSDLPILSASIGSVTDDGDGTWSWSYTTTDGPAENQTVTITVEDGHGNAASTAFQLVVANTAPLVTGFVSPTGPVALGDGAIVSAIFTDAGSGDTHSCQMSWDDGSASESGTIDGSGGSGTCSASHDYATTGVYAVAVTVTDDDGATHGAVYQYVVVFDADGGFATGGGWIDSPAGAYAADPDATGRANFGFVSRYRRGGHVPEGQTEFQFHAANFNFHSTAYEWLVVAGHKAQYRGNGTVNGAGDYGFLLTATDGQAPGGGDVDQLRIKVWDRASHDVVYDNRRGASDDIDAASPQAIGGGSIVIHRGDS